MDDSWHHLAMHCVVGSQPEVDPHEYVIDEESITVA